MNVSNSKLIFCYILMCLVFIVLQSQKDDGDLCEIDVSKLIQATDSSTLCGPNDGGQALVVEVAEDEIMIAAESTEKVQQLKFFLESIGATYLDSYPYINIMGKYPKSVDTLKKFTSDEIRLEHWRMPEAIDTGKEVCKSYEDKFNYIAAQPEVGFLEPNYIYYLASNDRFIDKQRNLRNISVNECWKYRTGDSTRVIGVLDTGIDWQHPDLINNIWQNMGEDADGDGSVLEWDASENKWVFDKDDINGIDDDGNGYDDDFIGWNFTDGLGDENDPRPSSKSHGTHVSGIIAGQGNNGIGISGVCQDALLMPLKCFDDQGRSSTSILTKALEYTLINEVKITNNSWGGEMCAGTLYGIIETLNREGALFITAAGNENKNNDTFPLYYPASFDLDNIISVMSVDSLFEKAQNSNYGSKSVDIAAPGFDIYSTMPEQNNGDLYGSKSGTSMATPHVTGAAVLLWAEEPGLTHHEVKDRLLCRAKPMANLKNKCVSGGVVNVMNAIADSDNLKVVVRDCDQGAKCFSVEPKIDASFTWTFYNSQFPDNPVLSREEPTPIVFSDTEEITRYCVDLKYNCDDTDPTTICGKTIIESSSYPISSIVEKINTIDEIFISVDLDLETERNTEINIFNSSGNIVEQFTLGISEFDFQQELLIEITNFPYGIYTIQVETEKGFLHEKIINL